VSAVFGPPIVSGDTTVIPVAAIRLGFGFGTGVTTGERAGGGGGGGSGSGGGGGGIADPRGSIVIGPDGVRYEPTLDVGRIALAGILMAAWGVFWVALTMREVVRRRPVA
jgi:uncharacterized spore protein YtfJ